MQSDMHFYGTYALARIAGFSPDLARTVATAAQFVDDAVSATPINLGQQGYLLPTVSAHEMLDKNNFNRMDQWQVWAPFHFLPGGQGNTVDERLICLWGEPGNKAVDDIITLTLEAGATNKPYALHLLGIITHVIQDTYAHYGFSGMASPLNKVDQRTLQYFNVNRLGQYIDNKVGSFWARVKGSFAEASMLGHAGVATYPDRPYLNWTYEYEEGTNLDINYLHQPHDNPTTFFMACTRLHAVYDAFLNGHTSIQQPTGHLPFTDTTTDAIKFIIGEEGKKDERAQYWRDKIISNDLFDHSNEDTNLQYLDEDWIIGCMEENPFAASTNAYQYNIAASKYLNKVHDDILPEMGILLN